MQPQEQIAMPTIQFAGFGAELLSLMQLLFFLALGYAVAKLSSHFSLAQSKVAAKKIEEEDQPCEATQEITRDESQEVLTPTSAKVKARHSNAQVRKRQRKALEAGKEEHCKGLECKTTDAPSVAAAELVEAKVEVVEQTTQPPPVEEPELEVDATVTETVEVKTNDRVAKLMAKKTERKARKALEKKAKEEQAHEDEHACQPGTLEEEKMIATEDEVEPVEETTPCCKEDTLINSSEAPEKESLEEVEEMQPLEEVTSFAHVDEQDHMEIEDANSEDEDNMEIEDANSEDEPTYVGSIEGISTPEVCLSPREMPSMWCGMPQPELACESIGVPQLIPQIEGWMPVLVPAEHAPPGAFDGIWESSTGERIVIEHCEATFENGTRWAINIHSFTKLSVEVEDEEFEAELDSETRCLKWSDGDIWNCIGQTEKQQQWANIAPANPEVPCLLWEGAQVMTGCSGEPFLPPPMPPQPMNTLIPQDAENWEMCWDWKKKGWCPRGSACDWYHPLAAVGPNFCEPCRNEVFDRPFADEQGGR